MDDNVLSVGETAAADLTDDRPVGDTLTQAMEQGFETITEERILDMQQRMPQIIAERRADRAGFEARLYARWRRALDLFEAIMVIAQESGQEFNQKHRAGASQNEDHVFDALSRLHARACLIASEVLALLRSGHASGAHARWRTLHELAVVAYFIEKHGEEVAERYLLHYMVESAKSAEEYQIYSARLNTEPFSPSEMADLQANADALCKRFGPEYRKHYGWAAAALHNRDPNFTHIEQAVSMQHMRPYYGMASGSIHAKPTGIAFDIGNMQPHTSMLAGPSNAGLADPGQGALISLSQITTTLLSLKPDVREVVNLRIVERLVDEAMQSFIEVHQQIKEEERDLAALREATIMTPKEISVIRARWELAWHNIKGENNGVMRTQAYADIRRLLAEVERLHSRTSD